jgi:hypothetical protein
MSWSSPETSVVRALGTRLELFVDRWLLAELRGADLRLHPPRSAGVTLAMDRPWEGRYSTYATILSEGNRHRLYYRGRAGLPETQDQKAADFDREWQVTCVAESNDGINWTRPNLGFYAVAGTRENNVVLADSVACTNFTPFIDTRPGGDPDERYKAVGGAHELGLELFASADGVRWRRLRRLDGVSGAFDSQNVLFWSEAEQCYVLYFRTWSSGEGYKGRREISRSTSSDLRAWTPAERVDCGAVAGEELYTHQTQPYFRAPHLYVAFPSRFLPARRVLSEAEFAAAEIWPRSWLDGISDGLFMCSRGGTVFDRSFREAFVRPGLDRRNWSPRNTYAALGMMQTSPTELSLLYVRHYAQPTNHLERFVVRLDGFGSIGAGRSGGEVLTQPLTFTGASLELNYATSAGGIVRVAICDVAGVPLPGFGVDDCDGLVGDELSRLVTWQGRRDVSALADRSVRLRFLLEDADVFALRFPA